MSPTPTMLRFRSRALTLVGLLLIGLAAGPVAAAGQRTYDTPDAAADALVAASRTDSVKALRSILGHGGHLLVTSGDLVADHDDRQRFVAAYDARHRLEFDGTDKATLLVGTEEWPLPIPLVHDTGGWHFDTDAGRAEILQRRIGHNELAVMEVCRSYVEGQHEFAAGRKAAGEPTEYAAHLHSHDGQHDGLYWPTAAGEAPSPLGPLVARAHAEGYDLAHVHHRPVPFYGYIFHSLDRQGTHAPGGAKPFVIDGHQTGGFALIAYPARWGDSGVMTFIVNQDGIVYEKNLGPETRRLAPHIGSFDPDATWKTARAP